MGKQWKQWQALFSWAPKSLQMVSAFLKLKKRLLLGRKAMTKLDSILKSRHYFADKGLSSKSYGFSSSQVWLWVVDHKESWAPKKDAFELWCWRRLLTVPGPARRSHQSILKSWKFIGRTDADAETPVLWSPDAKNLPIRKDPDAGKDWKQEASLRLQVP